MTQNPTVIAASLDDEALRSSVNALVSYVDKAVTDMSTSFNNAVGSMEKGLKKLGNIKVTSGGANDGGTSTSTKKQEELAKAAKETAISFDAQAQSIENLNKVSENSPKFEQDTLGALREQIAELQKTLNLRKLESEELRSQVDLLRQRKNEEKNYLTSTPQKELSDVLRLTKGKPKGLDEAEIKLQKLVSLQEKYRGTTKLSEAEQTRLTNAIERARQEVEKIKNSRPKSLKEVLGMDENSVEAITIKLRELKRVQIDPKDKAQVKALGDEYQRLAAKQRSLMGSNAQLAKSNSVLASSFGYIRNRIIYALTLGTLGSFVRNVREVRAEYEMLERSLGVLIGSFEKGSKIFNELNEMALKSPFTLIELGNAAKQLTAYNFAASEVVDTTRRLGDISAALGVPMERLTYNLGQIKAQGVLNARDARDFANAGFAIVPMLAQMYTEQKRLNKEFVTSADVYDMMSKKLVTYGDVLNVIERQTNEGGKFFDYQAKQAETLKVQLANLTLAMNNMYNEIGSENQGAISSFIKSLRQMFLHWRDIQRILLTLITTFGVYKGIQTLTLLNGVSLAKSFSVGFVMLSQSTNLATASIHALGAAISSIPFIGWATALAAVLSYFVFFKKKTQEVTVQMERFGESASKTIKKIDNLTSILKGATSETSTYKKALQELNGIFAEQGLAEAEGLLDVLDKRRQVIELIKEEAAERQRANMLSQNQEKYEKLTSDAVNELNENLQTFYFGGTHKEIRENADVISQIISSIVEEDLDAIRSKTDEEYEAEVEKLKQKISRRLVTSGFSKDLAERFVGDTWKQGAFVEDYVKKVVKLTNAYEDSTKKIEANAKAAREEAEAGMTLEQKMQATENRLNQAATSGRELYNSIYSIIELAQQKYSIEFDLKIDDTDVPKWMLNKKADEARKNAIENAKFAQQGMGLGGKTIEQTAKDAQLWARALMMIEDAANRRNDNKDKSDKILKALKDEISLVEKLQSDYEKLTRAGANANDALATVKSAYGSTIDLLNKKLKNWGLPQLDLSIITGKNPMQQLEHFKKVLDVLKGSKLGNLERIKAVESVIENLQVKVKNYNLDMVTKGLNNELGKLKEEYELGIEFDANPELGNVFADIMGVSRSELNNLPKYYAQVLSKAQQEINRILVEGGRTETFDLSKLLNKNDFDKWVKDASLDVNSELVKALNEYREYVNKVRLDETKKTIQNWSELISKYGTVQDKLLSITKESANEQIDIVRKFGSEEDISKAIDLAEKINISQSSNEIARLQKELSKLIEKVANGKDATLSINAAIEKSEGKNKAKAIWEDFKDSDEYIKMFDNLEYLSIGALDNIMNKLEEVKDKVREDPASMKAAFDSIEKVRETIMNLDPARGMAEGFNSFIQGISELSATNSAIKATAKYIDLLKNKLNEAKNEVIEAARELDDATQGGDKTKEAEAQEKLNKAKKKQKDTEEKIKNEQEKQNNQQQRQQDAVRKIRKGLGDLAEGAQKWGGKLQTVSDAISAVGNVFAAIGDEETAESINDLNKGFQIMVSVLGAVAAACIVVQAGLGAIYLVAMAIAGVFMGLAFLFEGAANRAITRQINESEATVRKLELAYKDLEAAIEDAYGAAEYGLKQAEISNKKLQLAELKRQLELEKSRTGKHYDQEKVDEYLEKVKDLENEIANMVEDITNDMLGIQSVGNAAEELVSSMIDAFRKGEDYMASYQDTFDKMIENMIVKAIASRVIGDRLQEIWDTLDATISERSKPQREKIKKIQENIADYEKKIDEAAQEIAVYESVYSTSAPYLFEDVYERYDKYTKLLNEENKKLQEAIEAASSAGQITPQDVNSIADMATSFKGEAMENFKALMDAFGIKFGDLAGEQELSNLQQGIQGITETTAGAIEAYLNGVSQQVYMHTDILVDIRDTLHTFDFSEQLGVQSEILLQLQNGYQTMNAMRTMMENWQTPAGNGIRVEML